MPRMPVKLATSYMLACCNVSSMRPAAFLASCVLLPAFSAQASGSVADAEAAETASHQQVEACAVAVGARPVVPPEDDSLAALPAGAAVRRADDSSAAVALPEDGSSAVRPEDDLSVVVALPEDDSPAVLSEGGSQAGLRAAA